MISGFTIYIYLLHMGNINTFNTNDNYIKSIPTEIIIKIALNLDYIDIRYLCLTNHKFNQIISNSPYILRNMFLKNHHWLPDFTIDDWNNFYLRAHSLYDISNPCKYSLVTEIKVQQISHDYNYGLFIDLDNNLYRLGTPVYDIYNLYGLTTSKDNCEPILVPGIKARQVSCGIYMAMVIDIDNNLYLFAPREMVQLYQKFQTPKNFPMIDYIGKWFGLNKVNLPILPYKAKQISVGGNYALYIDLDDYLYGFVLNSKTPDHNPVLMVPFKVKQVSVGKDHFLVIDMDTNVYIFEDKLKMIPEIKAQQISAGVHHSLILDIYGQVYAFGNNKYGQLGLGDDQPRDVPTMIPNLVAQQISGGALQSGILDINGNVWTTGVNKGGLRFKRYLYKTTLMSNIKALQIEAGSFIIGYADENQ